MNINYIVIGLLIAVVIGLILKKKKDDKDDDDRVTNSPIPGIQLDFRINPKLGNWFINGLRFIKKGNQQHYDSIRAETSRVVLEKKSPDGRLAQAPLNGSKITFFEDAMLLHMKSNPSTELWAFTTSHEFVHLKGLNHGQEMNTEVKRLVDSYGGKVYWKA